jgi:pimeloyl-ACP methyl ester carboxylesterase
MSSCSLQGTRALCGTLRVPEDPSKPAGRAIDLRVAVIPAVAATPKSDPIFWLSGGPGGAATGDFWWTPATFSMLHADRDFVMVDQRGTGGSHRLVAPTAPDTSGLSDDAAAATIKTWLAATLAEMDGDPRFYTTSVAMDDLDLVRAALGYDQINLYGVSYGATAAQYYLRQYEGACERSCSTAQRSWTFLFSSGSPPTRKERWICSFDRCDRSAVCAGPIPGFAVSSPRCLRV